MTALILKSTAAMLVALVITLALRRSRASLRHLLLSALFAFLLLLPVAQTFAPQWQIAVREPEAIERVVQRTTNVVIAPATNTQRTNLLPQIYGVIAASLLLWLALGVMRLKKLANDGEVWLDGTAAMNAIANDANIRRPALVILSDRVQVPLTFGFRRSTIVLPIAAKTWSEDELARALRHELEHVRREDWLLQLMARAACALYWPNPLAWIAWRRFCLEAERACDDAVVGAYVADEYAGQLVSLARTVRGFSTVPALGMAGRSRLASRVHAILDPLQRRGPHGRPAAIAVVVVMLALLASMAPARLISAAVFHDNARQWSWAGERLAEEAEKGNMTAIRQMLDAGFDVNTVAEGDGTALIGAARGGQVEMVRYLIERGADVNLASRGDGNPLIQAAAGGYEEIVNILIDEGADIDAVVPGDENPLINAAANGHANVVRLLLDRGANVNARVIADRGDVRTPLNMARRNGHHDIEQMLIAAGAKE